MEAFLTVEPKKAPLKNIDTLLYNDLWKYNGNTWTWVSGSNTGGEDGDYGIINIASPSNVPGARFAPSSVIDSKGVLWLFGGRELCKSLRLDLLFSRN